MRIKTRMQCGWLASVALIGVLSVAIGGAFRDARRAAEVARLTQDVSRGVFELRVLRADYVLYEVRRASIQWESKLRTLSERLDRLHQCMPGETLTIERIHRSLDAAGKLFADIQSLRPRWSRLTAGPVEAESLERMTAQMDINLMGMIGDAQRLSDAMYDELRRRQKRAKAFVFCASAIIAAVFTGMFLGVARAVLAPLGRLREGARIVASGNLTYRSGIASADEVGDLARAFDAMTAALGDTTASRDELRREIAERERAERQLRDTLDRLSASNRDLEQFAYVASHDLQEPLRKIVSFGNLLERAAGDGWPAECRDHLHRMIAAARRMSALISDLLAVSRVSSQGHTLRRTDLNAVLRDVLSDLEPRIRECGARVEAEHLPAAIGDPHQVYELFQNLLTNALKFRRADVPPVVRIRTAPAPVAPNDPGTERIAFTVEDNGIGFDNTHRERIFGVFTRLHSWNEYEGTGIGLALCRRIVERHGGTIEAEGVPEQGARFTIVLLHGGPTPAGETPAEGSPHNKPLQQDVI